MSTTTTRPQAGGTHGAESNGRPIAAQWAELAEALADWAWSRVVVRFDVYGSYRPDGGQFTAHKPLTRDVLVRHYRGESGAVMGLHSTSPDNICKAVAWDIDAHDDADDPEGNWRYALAITAKCGELGLRPLVFDSNGKGGYHVRVFFNKPIAAAAAHWLGKRLVADHAEHGFKSPPETFPKQAGVSIATPFGNWLRTPGGRHHKRAHWTRIYDREEGRWLEGLAAAKLLVGVKGDKADQVLATYKAEEEARPKPEADDGARAQGGLWVTATGGKRSGLRDKADENTVRDALRHLPAEITDAYDGWLGVGMALHSWDHGSGLALWEEFSQRCRKKYDPAACREKWGTFDASGALTIGTVFHEAECNGWVPPWKRNGTGHKGKAEEKPPPRSKPEPAEKPASYDGMSAEDLGIISADSLEPENVTPLWPDRLYVGKLDLSAGDGGLGKSQTAARIITSTTTGDPYPDGAVPTLAGSCIYLAAEDGQRDTVLPRLMAAGADLSKVKFVTCKVATTSRDGTKVIHFASFQDLEYWRAVIRFIGDARLIVADPIPAYLGRGVNDHKNQEVRSVLEPFVTMLDEERVALHGITHMGKSPDLKTPAHKILGSVAYSNLARTVHVAARDPEDKKRIIYCQVKNNLGPLQPALAFRIEEVHVPYKDGSIRTSRAVFEDKPIEADAGELLEAGRNPGKRRGPTPEKTRKLAVFLYEHLSDPRIPRPLGAIFDAAGQAGLVGLKKPDGNWSSGALLYQARKLVPELEDERAGWRVDDFKAPIRDGGRDVVHWHLVRADADF